MKTTLNVEDDLSKRVSGGPDRHQREEKSC